MTAMVALPQIGAAQRVVVYRPYVGFRPYVAYGFGWGPAWYSPYYYYPGGVYAVTPRGGDVKIETHMKDASVYVDGGFAGTTGKLKNFALQPGNHDIEIRNTAGQTLFHDRVHVLAGKTTEIKL
jgi:hypothetical protein